MPHCIIEYSQDLELSPKELIDAVFKGALASNLFDESHIKTRVIAFEHYQTAALKESFLHVTAKILSGRTLEQRTMLSETILKALTALALSSITITIDVIEMEQECYSKRVIE